MSGSPDNMSGLIWVQTVYQGYMYMHHGVTKEVIITKRSYGITFESKFFE